MFFKNFHANIPSMMCNDVQGKSISQVSHIFCKKERSEG